MSPSNTSTRRYGVNGSLIWHVNDSNTLRLAYTFDRGRHRQTSEAGYVSKTPALCRTGSAVKPGAAIASSADSALLRFRDRFSVAELNQVALEYRAASS